MTALEQLQTIGEIDVDCCYSLYKVRVAIGQWGEFRVQIWGKGISVETAADECLKKTTAFTAIMVANKDQASVLM